jgi:hypothetical protein
MTRPPLGLGLLAVGMLLLGGCGQGPTDTYLNMTTAAQLGDRDGFLEGFTPNSRKIVKGMSSLSEAYGFEKANPFKNFVFDRVVKEETYGEGEKIGSYVCAKACAVLSVEAAKGKQRGVQILMLETDEGWRIDLAEQQDFWKETK